MPGRSRLSRRTALKLGTAAAALPLVHIRTAGAAGKLSLGIVDHWVAAGNDVRRKLVGEWGEKNKVEVQIDFISGQGGKDLVTQAAESRAKSGHDIRTFLIWGVHQYGDQLVPLDDVMGRLLAKYGPVTDTAEYLAKVKGVWKAVPSGPMSNNQGSCGRLDIFRDACGLDLQAMYPAQPGHTALSDDWDWDHFLVYAEKCQKAGKPFGLAISNCNDSVDWFGSLFASYDAPLVAADGNILVKDDKVRQVLEYAVRLTKFLPAGVFGWDSTSNNKAFIADQTAFIFEAPSPWSVAKKDAPHVAENTWGFPTPKGPAGRFIAHQPQFMGIWDFSPNKSAAKDLIEYLSQREQTEQMAIASNGYDIPPFLSMMDFQVWADQAPPKGAWYNYPIRPGHNSRASLPGYPAPPDVAVQIYQNFIMPIMVGRIVQGGHSIDETVAWAAQELAGYSRG